MNNRDDMDDDKPNKYKNQKTKWLYLLSYIAFFFLIITILYRFIPKTMDILLTDPRGFVESYVLILKTKFPNFIPTFEGIRGFIVLIVTILTYCMNLRFILCWFPSFNPYTMPCYYIIKLTRPLIRFFESKLPLLFGFDFGIFFATVFLQILSEVFTVWIKF